MNAFQKFAAGFISFLLILPLTACSPASMAPTASARASQPPAAASSSPATPAPTAAVESPEPEETDTLGDDTDNVPEYDIADLQKLGITDKQYDGINALLFGALEMKDDDEPYTGHPGYFTNAASIPRAQLLAFAYIILDFDSESIGMDAWLDDGPLEKGLVEKVIKSAFNIDFKPQSGDHYRDMLNYKNGTFNITCADGESALVAETYAINREATGELLVQFNIINETDVGEFYYGKGQAVVAEDTDSLFGYRLVSLAKCKDTRYTIASVEASSCLPTDGGRAFAAKNAADGKNSTAWGAKSAGAWIQLDLGKPQNITGVDINFGDWSGEDAFQQSNQPTDIRLEFSDGTTMDIADCGAEDIGCDSCIALGKIINTSYIKITILSGDADEGTDVEQTSDGTDDTVGNEVYITDIKPI